MIFRTRDTDYPGEEWLRNNPGHNYSLSVDDWVAALPVAGKRVNYVAIDLPDSLSEDQLDFLCKVIAEAVKIAYGWPYGTAVTACYPGEQPNVSFFDARRGQHVFTPPTTGAP